MQDSIKVFTVLLVLLSMISIGIFSFLGINRSLGLDEAYSVFASNQTPTGIFMTLQSDTTPPFYYLLLSAWMRIFGRTEIAVRSLSAIFYVLSLIAVYVLGKSVYNDVVTGLLSSFLYMLSSEAIGHAQSARMHSLLGFFAVMSTLFFFRLFFFKSGSKKDMVLYVATNILGTFTHYWFFFVVFSQIVAHLLLFDRALIKRMAVAVLVSVLPFAIFWLPTMLSQMSSAAPSWIAFFIGRPGIYHLAYMFAKFYGDWMPAVPIYLAIFALLIFKVEGLKIGLRDASDIIRIFAQKQNLAFLTLLIASILPPFLISQVRPIFLPDRYTIIALCPMVMILGSLLAKLSSRSLLLVFCYILLAFTSVGFAMDRALPERYSSKLTAQYLVRNATDGDILIFTSLSQATIDYYLSLMGSSTKFTEISFPREVSSHLSWIDVNKLADQRYWAQMDTEADGILAQINSAAKKDGRIWLFYDNLPIDPILKSKLDSSLSFLGEADLRGSFFGGVLVYQKR